MSPPRHALAAIRAGAIRAAILSALALGACSSPCLDVQVLICSCRGQTQDEQNTCKTNAQAQENLSPPTDDELALCDELGPRCEAQIAKGCATLDTPEGRRECGIAAQ